MPVPQNCNEFSIQSQYEPYPLNGLRVSHVSMKRLLFSQLEIFLSRPELLPPLCRQI